MKTYSMKRKANAEKFVITNEDWHDGDMYRAIEHEIVNALREKNKISELPLCLELKIEMDEDSYWYVFDLFTEFNTPKYEHKYDSVNEILTLWYNEVPQLDFEEDEEVQRIILKKHFNHQRERFKVDRYMEKGHRNGFYIDTLESWVNELKTFHMEEYWEMFGSVEYDTFEEFEQHQLRFVYGSNSYEELFERLYDGAAIFDGEEEIYGGCLYGNHYVLVVYP